MIGERWQRILQTRGDTVALWYPGGELRFEELDARARALSTVTCPRLGRFFLAQGDGPDIIVALLASLIRHHPVQVVEKDRSRRVPVSRVPNATDLVKQTVGSSGQRRCQFFTWEQIAADVDRLHAALKLEAYDVALAPLSVAHSFGLTTTILQTLLHGLPTHWLPTPFPACMEPALGQHERVFLPGVPAMWKAWLLSGLNLNRVRLAVAAGSPLTLELETRVRDGFGLKLHNLYGTSECGSISYDAGEEPRSQTEDLGQLLPGVRASTDDEGRLLVESSSVGLGYDQCQSGEVFGNGQHRTWDRIQFHGDRLMFQGCLGQGINVASRKLSPSAIAEKIRTATGLRHVRIHGMPSRDSERVQDVVACVDLPPDQLTQAFKSRACTALAPWEVPRHWRIENPPRHLPGSDASSEMYPGALPA